MFVEQRPKILASLAAAFLCLAPGLLSAQQADQSKAKATVPAPAVTDKSDAALRAKIMTSDAWKQVDSEFQKWLSQQTIYTPAEVNRINQKLAAQIRSMPTSDLQGFLDDWQAKLKVLLGKNFQEAQNWLGQYMVNMADGYQRNYLKRMGLSDIANLSAAQLEAAITRIRADRLAIIQSQSAFDSQRNQQVQAVMQSNAAAQQQPASTGSYGSPGFNTLQSPYHPPKFNPPPTPQMPFYMTGDGRIGYALPF
jgi:multidrug efflux pump subunit AcrB